MTGSFLLQGIVTAASMGLGCSVCGGGSMVPLLSGYLLTHAGGFHRTVQGVFAFLAGKCLSVATLCAVSSLLGSRLLHPDGMAGGLPVRAVVDGGMIAAGAFFLIRWIAEKRGMLQRDCGRCREKTVEMKSDRISLPALLGMGAGYGVLPCAPLVMMAGYAATVPAACAVVSGGVFACCSFLSPMLLLLLMTGVLAGKICLEIPQYLSWFRAGCYVLMILLFTADLAAFL